MHGIRTHGSWAEMVTHVLEETAGVRVVTIKYGFFDVFRFLSPFGTRHGPVRRILRELRDIRALMPTARISVIAHSFGTYGLVEALREPDISLHRVIFCGSIVPDDFRRAPFRAQLGPEEIVNDCGTHDIWPILAKSVTWGYGATGSFGFGTVGVHDRFNKFGHGDYFDENFVREYWVPFIRDGEIKATQWERKRTTPPYWMSLLSWFPLRWLLPILFVAGLFFATRPEPGEIRVAFGHQAWISHYLGFPGIVAGVAFHNATPKPVNFSGVRLHALSPEGRRHTLEIEPVSVPNGPPVVPFPRTYAPGEKIEWNYSFFRYDLAFTTLRDEVGLAANQLGLWAVSAPDPSRQIMPQPLVEKARAQFDRAFIWIPGRWTLELEYLTDGRPGAVRCVFDLDKDEIEKMKRIVEYYPSGAGMFYPWASVFVGGAEPTSIETLRPE